MTAHPVSARPGIGRRIRCLAGLLAAAFLALRPLAGQAHPHAWIDVRSTAVFSPQGMLIALKEQWLFDELYSAAVMEGLASESPSGRATAQAFAAMAMENLEAYDYFTKITVDGHAARLGKAAAFEGAMIGHQLLLSFTAPLADPVDPVSRQVTYAIYDPSYYIQMMHRPEQAPAIEGKARRPCRPQLVPPNPTPEDIARAYALDRTEQADDDLGDLFAEKVALQCP